jgi:hypothetical protein
LDADCHGQDRAVGLSTDPNAIIVDGDDLEASRPTVQVSRPDFDLGARDEAMRAGEPPVSHLGSPRCRRE